MTKQTKPDMLRTRDQHYAAAVYACVGVVAKADKAAYGSMAHKLPVLIRTAGLAQALSFVDARSQNGQKNLLKDLAQVMGFAEPVFLLERSREAGLREYMRLTREALTALLWFKRFAQSLLDVDATDDHELMIVKENKNHE